MMQCLNAARIGIVLSSNQQVVLQWVRYLAMHAFGKAMLDIPNRHTQDYKDVFAKSKTLNTNVAIYM